jgi:hypothetical protein
MRLVSLSILILAFSGCATVKIHDDPWCADAGKYGAECFYAISKREFSLDKFDWDRLRVGQICSATSAPGEAFKNIRTAIEKLCADSSKCTYEENKVAARLKKRALNALDEFSRRAAHASMRASFRNF